MKVWVAIGLSVAVLAFCSGAMADQASAPLMAAGEKVSSSPQGGDATLGATADTVAHIAAVTERVAAVASASIVAPVPSRSEPLSSDPGAPPATVNPAPAVATTTAAAVAHPTPAQASVKPAAARVAKTKVAAGSDRQPANAKAAERLVAEAKSVVVRTVGQTETGTAAWYGGHYIGQRTSNGERLDAVHATAAHRTLPLNSLARVTNLRNGRSVVVRVTDRGPVDSSLLIDMSPRAADEIQMKAAGLVPVKVEQVVELPADAK